MRWTSDLGPLTLCIHEVDRRAGGRKGQRGNGKQEGLNEASRTQKLFQKPRGNPELVNPGSVPGLLPMGTLVSLL